MSRIDEIKARHYAITLTDGREICFQCVDDLRPGLVADWPCDTAHLLAELAAAQAREQALRRVARVSQGIIHEGLHGGRATDPEHQEMCEMPACRNIRAALAGGQGEG